MPVEPQDSGLGTRDSGLGTRDSGLGTRDSGLGGFHIMGASMIRTLSRLAAPALALPRAVKRDLSL